MSDIIAGSAKEDSNVLHADPASPKNETITASDGIADMQARTPSDEEA
jgi:hypothetical protein